MLPTASVPDATRAIRDVLLPVVAQGAIVRRRIDLLTSGRLPATFDHTTPRMGLWRK